MYGIQHKITQRLLAVLLTMALLFTITTACAKKPETPAALLSLGEKYLTDLDYENAIVQFLKVIEIEPMNVRAYAALAEIYTKTEQSGKAVELLQKAVDLTGDESLKRTLEELQPPEPEPEPQSSEVAESSSEPEETLTPEQAMLKTLYEQALSMDMDAAMDLFLTPEFIAMIQDAPENEHGYPTLEYEGITAQWVPDYDYFSVAYGPGSPETDGIEHSVWDSLGADMPTVFKGWTTRTYTNGTLNGPYERRTYQSVDEGVVLTVYTGNAVDGYKHGEELCVVHNVDGTVANSQIITYDNGIVRYTGRTNANGHMSTAIDQEGGWPLYYQPPEYFERKHSP